MRHEEGLGDGRLGMEFGKDLARTERRGHRERLKRARRWHWGGEDLSKHPQRWARAIETPTPCSCPMCGNPRKWFGEASVPERRFWQGWRESDQE